MPTSVFVLKGSNMYDAGAPDVPAHPKDLLDTKEGAYLRPLMVDGRPTWVLIGPWRRGTDHHGRPKYSLDGDEVSCDVVADGVAVSLLTLAEMEQAVAIDYENHGGGVIVWSDVPLARPFRFLAQRADRTEAPFGAAGRVVAWDIDLAGWKLELRLEADVFPPPGGSTVALAVTLRGSGSVASRTLTVEPRELLRCGRAHLWPDPANVSAAWRTFSLHAKQGTAKLLGLNDDGRVELFDPRAHGPGPISQVELTAPRVLVELWGVAEDQEARALTFFRGRHGAAAASELAPADVYIDLGTTTTYVVCRSQPSDVARALTTSLDEASIWFMNDPGRVLEVVWLPEGVRPPQHYGAEDVLRTAVIVREKSGSVPFRDVFLATPGALEKQANDPALLLMDNRLKWSFDDGRAPDQGHFRSFVHLLLLWVSSRLARTVPGLSDVRLHFSRPRNMARGSDYEACIGQACQAAGEATGLTMTQSGTWTDEGLLPYQAAVELELRGVAAAGGRKILVADLGGGTLDLAGYWHQPRGARMLFSRSLRIGGDECLADPFRRHARDMGGSAADDAKRWFLEITSTGREPMLARLRRKAYGQPPVDAQEAYASFVLALVRAAALAVHYDAQWAIETELPVVGSAAPDAIGHQAYCALPTVVLLSGGGWNWLGDEGRLRELVLAPYVAGTERRPFEVASAHVRRLSKLDVLSKAPGAPRAASLDSPLLDAVPAACAVSSEVFKSDFVRYEAAARLAPMEVDMTRYPPAAPAVAVSSDHAAQRGGYVVAATEAALAAGAAAASAPALSLHSGDVFVARTQWLGFGAEPLRVGPGFGSEPTVSLAKFAPKDHDASFWLYCARTLEAQFRRQPR